ncbi:MAG: hypothetical protein OXI11_12470 [Gammaproteobacteria bacterium]|nr:hypothetical protein [Gammaproteobacteria bacterium]MXW46965.1 hypothetical protein [Gammaproteobacteria bacterium]MYD02856.1 hypothetical protein [Gammaproteobacteria bacterium]MYI24433.1 hypothetical protein [Gammaproteobacteria bacterium]
MPNNAPKNFDCRRFVRKARAEIEAETADMSPRQVVEYYRTYPYDRPHAEIDASRLPWWQSDGDRGENFDCIAYVRWARAKLARESNRPQS